MPPTKVCMFYELSETILLFGLRYLHLDLFQFLHRYLSLHVQFCLYVFQGKIVSQFWKTGVPPHSQQTTRLVFLSDFLKLYCNDYSMIILIKGNCKGNCIYNGIYSSVIWAILQFCCLLFVEWIHVQAKPTLYRLRNLPAHEAERLEDLLNVPFFGRQYQRKGFLSLPKTEDRLPKKAVPKVHALIDLIGCKQNIPCLRFIVKEKLQYGCSVSGDPNVSSLVIQTNFNFENFSFIVHFTLYQTRVWRYICKKQTLYVNL